jgi:hypothetical protein
MLQRERVGRRRYLAHTGARADVCDYIERFYNPRMRRRLAIEKRVIVGLKSTVRKLGPNPYRTKRDVDPVAHVLVLFD